MKASARSYRRHICRLNWRADTSKSPPHGNSFASVAAAASTRMMPVASRGSKKPLESPMATQFLYQWVSRYPGVELDLARAESFAALPTYARNTCSARVVVGVGRRIHVADAAPRIEPDVPGPARLVRRRNGVRGHRIAWLIVWHLYRERGVAEQHRTAGFVRHVERLADELRTESGAVDVQVCAELAMMPGRSRNEWRRPRAGSRARRCRRCACTPDSIATLRSRCASFTAST